MIFRMRALGAPLLAVALALLGGSTLSASLAQAADRTAPAARTGGFLGVRTQELTTDLRDSYGFHGDGVLVSGVSSDTPADRIGIREGDIITRIDDHSVDSPRELADLVRSHDPGTRVSVTVWRNGRERSLGRVALGDVEDAPQVGTLPTPEAPDAPEPPSPPRVERREADRGDRDDADKDDADKNDDDLPGMGNFHEMHGMPGMPGGTGMMAFGLGRGRLGVELGESADNGVLITRVLDDTPADKAGLKAGDVIVEFDGRKVDGPDDLRSMVRDHAAGDVELRVERRGRERTFTAHLGERQEMQFRGLPGGNGWQGWMDERGNGTGKAKERPQRRVYRYRVPSQGEIDRDWQGLSPEDRAQLQRDIQQLRDDLERMRRELREHRQKGGDDVKGDDDDHGGHHDSDDEDDDSGN